MKRVACLMSGMLFVAGAAAAQPPARGGQPVTVAAGLQQSYAQIKELLTAAANKLSDADYNFRPTPEIRPYGALFTHVADAHYLMCAEAKGLANPNQATSLEKTKTSRADVIKALADSFAFCDDAFASLNDQTVNQMMSGGRGGQQAKGAILLGVIGHDNEMYGISTVYDRLKGVVPPGTEMMNQMRRGGPGREGQGAPGRGRQ